MEAVVLQTKLMNSDKFISAVEKFPKAMRKAMVHFLYSTRKSYIGTKGNDGLFRRKHARMKYSGKGIFGGRQGSWPKNVINAYRGSVDRSLESMDALKLIMGTGYKSNVPFIKGLYGMEKSTPISNISSSKNMVFPVYKNLAKRGRLVRPLHVGRKNKLLQKTLEDDQTFSVKRGDATYIFDQMDRYKSGAKKGMPKQSALLFILKKKFTQPKLIDFFQLWQGHQPKSIRRLDSLIKQQLRGIARGYVDAN
jgi:hypothetical protein